MAASWLVPPSLMASGEALSTRFVASKSCPANPFLATAFAPALAAPPPTPPTLAAGAIAAGGIERFGLLRITAAAPRRSRERLSGKPQAQCNQEQGNLHGITPSVRLAIARSCVWESKARRRSRFFQSCPWPQKAESRWASQPPRSRRPALAVERAGPSAVRATSLPGNISLVT